MSAFLIWSALMLIAAVLWRGFNDVVDAIKESKEAADES